MKRYKLLKDLPTFKAGDLFYISEYGALVYDDGGFGVMAYAQSTLEKFPNILTEWFEEVEPTDSIHWKPKIAEKYFYINECGDIEWEIWNNGNVDNRIMAMGLVYPTEEACRKAKERKLAEVRLRRTSTFKPDFENGNGGYVVDYDYTNQKLECYDLLWNDSGEIVRYATRADAQKSIRENREDWLIYFGVKE